jgi:hypothetical protein
VLIASVVSLIAQTLLAQDAATILNKDNQVEVARGGASWVAANGGELLNVGDKLRTGEDSRAKVRLADGSVLQLDELTTIEIKAPSQAGGKATLSVPGGAAYFFSGHGKSGREVKIETPSANGAIRGTAFLLKVNRYDGRTSVSMMEGEFQLENDRASTVAQRGQQAEIARGAPPVTADLDDSGKSGPWYLVVENRLRTLHGLSNAERSDFFDAFPAATKEWRIVAPQLAGAATFKKTEWARDILKSSFGAVGPDCPLLKRILASIIEADPSEASELVQLAVSLFPKCADEFEDVGRGGGKKGGGGAGFGGGPAETNGNFGNPPGLNGFGGGQGNLVAICHNGQTIFLPAGEAQAQLRKNPGDTVGPCQVTPFQNP